MRISDLLVSEFDEETKKTRATLERVPDKPDFVPHSKSMPLGRLAPHVAELSGFGLSVLTTPGLDFAQVLYTTGVRVRRPARPGVRRGGGQGSHCPRGHDRRSVEPTVEAVVSGQADLRGFALSRLSTDVSQPHRASSGSARRLLAHERRAGASHLRPIGRRSAWLLTPEPSELVNQSRVWLPAQAEATRSLN